MASVEVMTACENVCRDFGWVTSVDPRIWQGSLTLLAAVIASCTALYIATRVYIGQKKTDRRLEIFGGLLAASVEVLALANRLRKQVDNVCMNFERLKELENDECYVATLEELEQKLIEFQLLAPEPVFDAATELLKVLGQYRRVPMQRLMRWERDAHSFGGPEEANEENIQRTCDEVQLKFAAMVQKHIGELIGYSDFKKLLPL